MRYNNTVYTFYDVCSLLRRLHVVESVPIPFWWGVPPRLDDR